MKPYPTVIDGLPRAEYTSRPDQAAKRKAYRESHKEEHSEYYRAYRERHPNRSLFRAAQHRSKVKGLDFNLSYDDIVIPNLCPILDIPIVCYAGRGKPGGRMDSPSLDRIDNEKGYTKDNIQVISHKANSMKFTASPEELLKFADWIYKTYGK